MQMSYPFEFAATANVHQLEKTIKINAFCAQFLLKFNTKLKFDKLRFIISKLLQKLLFFMSRNAKKL